MERTSHSSTTNDDTELRWRRAALLVRALLPQASDAAAAMKTLADRASSDADWPNKLNQLVRTAVDEQRRNNESSKFSEDLVRQLIDSFPTSLTIVRERAARLANLIDRLPFAEKEQLRRRHTLGMSSEQLAVADGRPASAIARDLTILHGTLVSAIQQEIPDGGPPPPGGAADLGRLSDQLLENSITEDGRLVLETLLLADPAAQAHYHRHVALAVELAWYFGGNPKLPEKSTPDPTRELSARELAITAAFLVACAAAIVFVILVLSERFR